MAGNTVAQDRIRIFNRSGNPLCEFRAAVERSWAIGDEGRAQFIYPTRRTDIVKESNIQYGNWLLIENNQLPAWVGVIDTPRQWGSNIVTISAYTPEHVFAQRRGPAEIKISGSAGTIFAKLITYLNSKERTCITPGDIWTGGARREETLAPTMLNDDLRRIYERSLEEYTWRPVVQNGKLVVFADWVRSLGIDTSCILQEGKGGGNLEFLSNNIMVEDGQITNDMFGYGDGATWKDRITSTKKDASSIYEYGLRQGSEEFWGVTSKVGIDNNTLQRLNELKQPANTFNLNVLNVAGTYAFIRLGNRLNLRFENIGFANGTTSFDTTVRITGMVYDNAIPNKIELAVQEYFNE